MPSVTLQGAKPRLTLTPSPWTMSFHLFSWGRIPRARAAPRDINLNNQQFDWQTHMSLFRKRVALECLEFTM
jgi:hypothetical protein